MTTSVHSAYQTALTLATKNPKHAGRIAAPATGDTLLVEANYGSTVLSCLIDNKGTVVEAKHHGSLGLLNGLLDAFCDQLIARPIQEGSEHATIRLERALRDPKAPAPVEGLVTPENADPLFLIPLQLIRAVFEEYMARTGTTRQWNQWEGPLTPAWLRLSAEEKTHKVEKILAELLKEQKLPFKRLDILTIKNDRRIILSHNVYSSHPQFGHHLMALERGLKDRIDSGLELVSESLEDKNKREERTHRDSAFSDRKV